MTPIPSVTLWADTTTLIVGQATVIHWCVGGLDPDRVTITASIGQDPQWVSNGGEQQSSLVVMPSSTTTYVVSSIDPEGQQATADVTITVVAVPEVSFTATASNSACGQYTLVWSVSSPYAAVTVEIDQGIGEVAASGSTPVVVLSGSTTYTLAATNAAGTSTASATISMGTYVGGSSSPTTSPAIHDGCGPANNFNGGADYPVGLYYVQYVQGAVNQDPSSLGEYGHQDVKYRPGVTIDDSAGNTQPVVPSDEYPGLFGVYYQGSDFTTGTLMGSRVDGPIDFNMDLPGWPGFGIDTTRPFCVRWMGIVRGQWAEPYGFNVTSNGGSRLVLSNEEVSTTLFDNFGSAGTYSQNGTFALGQTTSEDTLRLEYYNSGNGAVQVDLAWFSDHQTSQVIPAAGYGINGGQYYQVSDVELAMAGKSQPYCQAGNRPIGIWYSPANVGAEEASPMLTYMLVGPSPIVAVSASPSAIWAGSSSSLSWTSNAASTSINPGIGSVDGVSGTLTVSPLETTTYTVTGTTDGFEPDSASVTVTVTPPAPPVLSAAPQCAGQVLLSWTEPGPFTSFNVLRRTPDGGPLTQIASTSSQAYLDTPPSGIQMYLYAVQAVNNGVSSAASNTVGVVPGSPGPVSAVAQCGGTISLSWSAAGTYTYFNVLRSTSPATGFTIIGTTAVMSYLDTPPSSWTTYYYLVQAVNGAASGLSPAPASAQAMAVPGMVTGVTVMGRAPQVVVAANLVANASAYGLYRSTVSGAWGTAPHLTNETPFFVDTLPATPQTWYYVIAAVNECGVGPQSVEVSVGPTPPAGWASGEDTPGKVWDRQGYCVTSYQS
ncbi:MAG: hypothetical protein ACLQVD_06440 [Capsulimonadaceae bacterium]